MDDDKHPEILLAEDVLVNRIVAVKMLKHLGYPEPDRADNGQQAVDAALARHYDIILMDIQMPVMDGLQATREILSHLTDSPPIIVGVTAHALDSHQQECLDAGMRFHLTKPIELNRLKEVLTQCEDLID